MLYSLARNDMGIPFLDEIASQKYARPSLDELLRAGDHGVDYDYVARWAGPGIISARSESLIRTRDHGVDMDFIAGLKTHGLTGLSVEELVRARDHGVDPDYIGGMKPPASTFTASTTWSARATTAWIRLHLRDEGRRLRPRRHRRPDPRARSRRRRRLHQGHGAHGFRKLPLEHLIKARDHGVDIDYINDMKHHGYDLDLDELIGARDHGVDDEFVAGFIALGYKNLTIEQLIASATTA
jgi:hypothetical protein